MLPHLSEGDYRDPLFRISIQGFGDDINGSGLLSSTQSFEYGFYFLSVTYWVELIGMMVIQMVVAAATGFFLYHTIVQPKRADTSFAILLGFGAVLPFWLIWPIVLTRQLDIRNAMFKFAIGCVTPTLSMFRTTECIFGFAPENVTKSAREYAFYYSSVLIVARSKNGSLIPCPLSKVVRHLRNFLFFLMVTGTVQSIMIPYPSFAVFGGAEDWYGRARFFSWQLYANSLLQAILFQMYLTTYCEGLALAFAVATGYQTQPLMSNPLFGSKSPSDFWGRRWNLVVHTVLKNGVFKPVRRYFSKTTAVVAAFLASAAFHEWLLLAVFFPSSGQLDPGTGVCISSCYTPTYGNALVFFLWQALLIAMEIMVGGSPIVQQLSKTLPQPVKTSLIIAMGIPLAHYFTEPYFRSGFFFVHGSPGLPMIQLVQRP